MTELNKQGTRNLGFIADDELYFHTACGKKVIYSDNTKEQFEAKGLFNCENLKGDCTLLSGDAINIYGKIKAGLYGSIRKELRGDISRLDGDITDKSGNAIGLAGCLDCCDKPEEEYDDDGNLIPECVRAKSGSDRPLYTHEVK